MGLRRRGRIREAFHRRTFQAWVSQTAQFAELHQNPSCEIAGTIAFVHVAYATVTLCVKTRCKTCTFASQTKELYSCYLDRNIS